MLFEVLCSIELCIRIGRWAVVNWVLVDDWAVGPRGPTLIRFLALILIIAKIFVVCFRATTQRGVEEIQLPDDIGASPQGQRWLSVCSLLHIPTAKTVKVEVPTSFICNDR